VTIVERLVPDALWELFRSVAPATPTRPQGGGRRRYGDREVLAAIVFVATSGCAWRQLPPVFGPSGPTAHRRYTEWGRAHVWADLQELLRAGTGPRGDLEWSRRAVDAVAARAQHGWS
jgi:transposase